MRKNKKAKLLTIILVLLFILPSGFAVYSMVGSSLQWIGLATDTTPQPTASPSPTPTTQVQTAATQNTGSMEISAEIQALIRQSDPANFDRNLANYKNLLTTLNVHSKFKNEIERLIAAGHKLPDILVAYEFLNDSFGKMQDIELLVKDRETGKSWTAVFEGYDKDNPEFVPRSFDPEELDKLMKTQGINTDDIMIADRVAQKVAKPVDEVIGKKIAGAAWKEINAEYEVVNGQDRLLHVPVAPEEIDKNVSGDMTKQKVVQAYVIAAKMGRDPVEILNEVKAGATKEQIYDECYTQKYY